MPVQWELLFFSLFVGLGMGAFGFIAVTELTGNLEKVRMPGAITALVAVLVGGMFSFFHLGHPERIFHILGNVGSGIAQELIVTTIAGALIVAYIFLLKWEGAPTGMRKTVAGLGLLFAVIVPFATGKIYVLPSRPAWDTWILPILFVASAAVLGMFTMHIWTMIKEKEELVLKKVNKLALFSQIFFAVTVIAYVVYISMAPHPHESRAVGRVLTGDLAIIFWLAVVIIGLFVPFFLTCRTLVVKKRSASSSAIESRTEMAAGIESGSGLVIPLAGLICALVGAASIRMIMYLMGSSVHQFFTS